MRVIQKDELDLSNSDDDDAGWETDVESVVAVEEGRVHEEA